MVNINNTLLTVETVDTGMVIELSNIEEKIQDQKEKQSREVWSNVM